MAKYNWEPIEEMDLDDGTHTCYAAESGGFYIYLTQRADETWDIELKQKGVDGYSTQANCKTLTSAKRWAARYL